jgi:hypothetical protein
MPTEVSKRSWPALSLQADLIIDTTRPQEPIRGGPLAF